MFQNGMVERIEMVNFMCHSHLTIEFGHCITYITGSNGSGKSTILTALVVVFGGNASNTQRATKMQEFVKEGSDIATVSITIANAPGETQYNGQIFGNKILIKRIFNKQGTGKYELKNIQGKTVSTRKEDVAKIAEHFGIYTENPMTVLSQEVSKKFLSRFSPEDRFCFYLEATNISRIIKDVQETEENALEMERILGISRRNIQEIEQDVELLKKKIELGKIKETLEVQIGEIEREVKFSALSAVKEEHVSKKRELDEIDEGLLQMHRQKQEMQSESENTQRNKARLCTERETRRDEHRDCVKQIKHYETQNTTFSSTLDEIGKENTERRKKIAEHRQVVDFHKSDSKEAILNDVILKQKSDLRRKEEDVKEKQNHIFDLGKKKHEMEEATRTLRNKDDELELVKRKLLVLSRAGEKKTNLFGSNVEEILDAIEKTDSFHRKPLGPLGMHVELKDKKWAKTMSSIVGNLLTNFIAHDHHDREILQHLLEEKGIPIPPIIVIGFDQKKGAFEEPDKKYQTALRVVGIENEVVRNVLVLFCGIDKILLIEERVEAERVMKTRPKNAEIAYTIYAARISVSSRIKSHIYGGKETLYFEDHEEIKKRLEMRVAILRKEREDAKEQLETMEDECEYLKKQEKRRLEAVQQLQKEIGEARLDIERNKLRQQNITVQEGGDVSALKEEIDRLEGEIKSAANQQTRIESQMVSNKNEILHQKEEERRLEREFKKIEAVLKTIEDEESRANKEKTSLDQKQDALFQKKSSGLVKQVEDLKTKCTVLEGALGSYAGPQKIRPIAQIEHELEGKRLALQDMNGEDTETFESKEKTVVRINEKEREKQKLFEGEEINTKLLKNMLSGIEDRKQKIRILEEQTSTQTKALFGKLMQCRRNMSGSLVFDFEKKRLLIVADSGITRKNEDEKENKMLSGGEKSFTVTCFLLSLWESIDSPFRFLDEFDVFMDSANRRIANSLLLKHAKKSKMQFVIITPLSLKNIPDSPDIKKIYLKGFEKSQRTILETIIQKETPSQI
eukprot:GHVN01098133.1.p1 GENE.GHVN01098133.1~~GHVN01098133.1.p1  ORF type:complete len:1025 (-),score=179.56 GHVN01098133.1:562-3636(-)